MKNIKTSYRKGLVMLYPRSIEMEYKRKLLIYVKDIKLAVRNYIIGSSNFASSYQFAIRKDDINDDLDNVIKAILVYTSTKAFMLISSLNSLANKINIFNLNIFKKFIKSVPEITDKIKEEIKMWVSENIDLIVNIPVLMMTKVKDTIHSSVRESDSMTSLKEGLRDVEVSTEKRAKFIARDQVGKLNGNIVRQRNLGLGITEYEWLTSRDERVRHSHKVLQGKICSWDNLDIYKNNFSDKKWNKRSSIGGVHMHPEEDYNCRCTSIAIIPSFVGSV